MDRVRTIARRRMTVEESHRAHGGRLANGIGEDTGSRRNHWPTATAQHLCCREHIVGLVDALLAIAAVFGKELAQTCKSSSLNARHHAPLPARDPILAARRQLERADASRAPSAVPDATTDGTGQVTPVPASPQYPLGTLWRYCWW
jgi:hypothetical protein